MNRRNFLKITSLSMCSFLLLGKAASASDIAVGGDNQSQKLSFSNEAFEKSYIEKNGWIIQTDDKEFMVKHGIIKNDEEGHKLHVAPSFWDKVEYKIEHMFSD